MHWEVMFIATLCRLTLSPPLVPAGRSLHATPSQARPASGMIVSRTLSPPFFLIMAVIGSSNYGSVRIMGENSKPSRCPRRPATHTHTHTRDDLTWTLWYLCAQVRRVQSPERPMTESAKPLPTTFKKQNVSVDMRDEGSESKSHCLHTPLHRSFLRTDAMTYVCVCVCEQARACSPAPTPRRDVWARTARATECASRWCTLSSRRSTSPPCQMQ